MVTVQCSFRILSSTLFPLQFLPFNFPKKGDGETLIRGPLKRRRSRRLSGREGTFGQHLFSENWKVKIEEEKGWKKECENAFCKIRNWKCKMPCEKKKRIRRERWTITISLNIDFFFSSTIYISSSIREKNRVRVGEVFSSSIILKTGFFFISTLLFLLNRNGIQC